MPTQSPVEAERQRRICVAVWAYAYEYLSASIVSDAKFDETCKEIDLSIKTGNPKMDKWFKKNFDPCTGSWVGQHPNLDVLHARAIRLCQYLKIPYTDRG